MKKLLALTSLATVATLSMSTLTFANSPQKPEDVNTVTAVSPSIIIDRTTLEELIPIRTIAENHGFQVDWINETKTTVLSKDNHQYSATIGSNEYDINGRTHILETQTQIIDGVTYVPTTFAILVENDLNGQFDFNNPNIDSGYNVDVIEEGSENVTVDETQDYTTLPAEIN